MTLSSQDNTSIYVTYAIYATCAPQNLAKVEQGFNEDLIRMLKHGLSDEEILITRSERFQVKIESWTRQRFSANVIS